MNKALILAGPSAVGKTTVAMLMEKYGFEIIRSATTRAPRGDGKDDEYIYISREDFLGRISRGEMLEHTEFAGNLYGTPKSEVDRVIAEGKLPLMILDLCGVRSLTSKTFDFRVVSVYIWDYPSVIEERLRLRYEGSEEGMRRLKGRLCENDNFNKVILSEEIPFDAFVRNLEPEECASLVLEAFNAVGPDTIRASIPEELKNTIS